MRGQSFVLRLSVRREFAGACAAFALLSATSIAGATEPSSTPPLRFDVTEASSVVYNFDNRDFAPHQVETVLNDDWGMWYNRLNVQARWGGAGGTFVFALRLDNVWFFAAPDPTSAALELTERRGSGQTPAPEYFRQKLSEAGVERSNRFINWLYPAKYSLLYTTPSLELTLGDYSAQLGRGLVLSVRKVDELSSDTTIRGVRLTHRVREDALRLKTTLLMGSFNPLRVDDASGRYLGVDASDTGGFLALTEAGMPRAIVTDFVEDGGDCRTFATCTYAPDAVLGAQLEAAVEWLKLGTQVSFLIRKEAQSSDPVRSAGHVEHASEFFDRALFTGSQAAELVSPGGQSALYVEAALQRLSDAEAPERDPLGHALYASLGFNRAPLSLLGELKHYRRFFPLSANVDVTHAREFGVVQYNAPPTTEALFVDTAFLNANTCVSGGRLKGDVALGTDESVFAWAGHYRTWAERAVNTECETSDENLNVIWDWAAGAELTSQQKRSRANFTLGARFDETEEPIVLVDETTSTFYREFYLRYDVIRFLTRDYSLAFQGWHRFRRETIGGPEDPWFEGHHLTGVTHKALTVALGVEYDSSPGTAPSYFNGQLVYDLGAGNRVSLFAGQRRGALRCVAGVCRVFPPFEGARLDVTARF